MGPPFEKTLWNFYTFFSTTERAGILTNGGTTIKVSRGSVAQRLLSPMARHSSVAVGVLLAIAANSASAFYLPGVAPQDYAKVLYFQVHVPGSNVCLFDGPLTNCGVDCVGG